MEDRLSWDELYPFMDEVKALARGLLRCECRASLQTTALVLSALRRPRLTDQEGGGVTWANRQYFFGSMYQAMTRALLDRARAPTRRREALARPEDLQVDDLQQTLARDLAQGVALLDARAVLKQAQLPWAEAIEYRYYGELTHEETARMIAVDTWTLQRWWEWAHQCSPSGSSSC